MAVIPDKYKDLFQKRTFAHLATVGADGSPQVTPVWVDFDGAHVRFNTAKGRLKDRNLRRNPKVALAIQDPAKYIGQDKYPWRRSGEVRVTYKIFPEKVQAMG